VKTVSLRKAKETLDTLVEQVAQGAPVYISGRGKLVVLVSEDEWRGLLETLHLASIPGMKESIIEGMRTPLDECAEEPGWWELR
jgi:antitoxin YefM